MNWPWVPVAVLGVAAVIVFCWAVIRNDDDDGYDDWQR